MGCHVTKKVIMRGHEVNSSQLESVLTWFKEIHKLKSIGGAWYHQANHCATQVVVQHPNATQIKYESTMRYDGYK
jgi:hypothetical protein